MLGPQGVGGLLLDGWLLLVTFIKKKKLGILRTKIKLVPRSSAESSLMIPSPPFPLFFFLPQLVSGLKGQRGGGEE